MSILKKTGLVSLVLFIGLFDIFIYWNYHLYYRARKAENPAKKSALLEKSNTYFPWNDLVFYELGKSYFDLGIGNLNDAAASQSYFRKSVQNLKKSVLINPASPFSHFNLAQSLLNLELISSENGTPFYDEFRKASLLAGEDSQVFNEVGRIFLSRWPELSELDRNFTLEILRNVVAKKDREKISLILNTWELNGKDYRIIEKLLPEDAQVYRQYAQFLGERSLSLEERNKYLAQAELLDFMKAKSEYQSGHFELALNLLEGIRFYQSPLGRNEIGQSEFSELKRSVYLNLARHCIEKGAGLSECGDYLTQYLNLENQAGNTGALESYLKDRGVIPRQFDKSFNDLDRLAFELLLLYKQTKYREIINFGRELERSFVIVPEAEKKNYLRILQIVGDSLQETGNLYDAGDFYQKALQIDPMNLGTLLRLRPTYNRLNDEKKLLEVNAEIEKVLTPKKVDFKSLQLKKGQVFRAPLILDGQNIVLDIYFENNEKEIDPLLSIFFNDRVVWDEYSQNSIVSIVLGTQTGKNVFQIASVNCPITLKNLIYRIP
jgi:tetratricopeptide (TPR) repeat protein